MEMQVAGQSNRADSQTGEVTAGSESPIVCDMSSAHRAAPWPAVVVMPGGTRLCEHCAVTMLRHAISAGRDFHVDPIGDAR